MNVFKKLFGVPESKIRADCIITPFLNLSSLFYPPQKLSISKGLLYETADMGRFTIIRSKLGSPLCGDAVLYLKDTPCQNIYLFGSCGGLKDRKIGDLVFIKKAFALEGFSTMLAHKDKTLAKNIKTFSPDKKLFDDFLKFTKNSVKTVNCATVSSLKLEEDYVDFFNKNNIAVCDMEASAVFAAARYIKKSCIALFYVSDLIRKCPFYNKLAPQKKKAINAACKKGMDFICRHIIKTNKNA